VGFVAAGVIAGAALVVLVIMIVGLVGPVRRFRRALVGYRARLDAQALLLQAGQDEMRGQLSSIGQRGKTEERHG
jgi:hypothetical protein